MFLDRFQRALSTFDPAAHRWAVIPLRNPHGPITQRRPSSHPTDAVGKQSLSLASWNVHGSRSNGVTCSKLIINHILQGPPFPDIIHLQEVTDDIRQSLLQDPRVRSEYLTTDAEDDMSFKGRPFATMTLLSNKRFGSPLGAADEDEGLGRKRLGLDNVFRMQLPCRYQRDALCVDIVSPAAPGAVFRLLNIHLDPSDALYRRYLQMRHLAGLLSEPGSSGGIIAGDFSATLPEGPGFVDTWGHLVGWGTRQETTSPDGRGATSAGVGGELQAGKLDRVATLNLKPDEIEILQPCFIASNKSWSDDYGLRCSFTI
ncbi:hypothetical protein D9619_009377 [Psilocybe cf. subviscida]|uniref:Endonuclease/exonuclease/phosphatase domain-containing protein n=1 Tax=Psilocybe cf. subviscida TaxID=2480587 RepID=A0A8H5BTX1_9AGAR|nr:hypothetical protein D9619_009377 [Psilocybe cf. subviscida]